MQKVLNPYSLLSIYYSGNYFVYFMWSVKDFNVESNKE